MSMPSQHSVHYGRGSHANAIHFYQQIQAQDLQHEELRIQRSFVERYWKVVSNPITLSLPNGSLWKMFWVKRGEDIWLQKKNWKTFARSLRCGDVLFFKYKGEGSEFKVKIFDDTKLEIDYSSMRREDSDNDDDDECVEITNDGTKPSTQVKETKNDNSTQEQTNSKRKINLDDDDDDDTLQNVLGANTNNIGGGTAKKFRSEALNKERDRSENPSYLLILSQSYIQEYKMRIPSKFSKDHLKDLEGTTKIKKVGDKDRSWEVKLKYDATNGHSNFSSGWKSFAQDNNLKAGDILKFEITQQGNPFSFRITITRVSNASCSEINQRQHDKLESFPVEGMVFVGNFSSGKLDEGIEGISRSCPKTKDSESADVKLNKFLVSVESFDKLTLPIEFLKRHKICNGNTLRLVIEGKSWSVEVSSMQFSKGWAEFVSGCKLKMGDTCVFKMIDEENLVFKVSIVLNV